MFAVRPAQKSRQSRVGGAKTVVVQTYPLVFFLGTLPYWYACTCDPIGVSRTANGTPTTAWWRAAALYRASRCSPDSHRDAVPGGNQRAARDQLAPGAGGVRPGGPPRQTKGRQPFMESRIHSRFPLSRIGRLPLLDRLGGICPVDKGDSVVRIISRRRPLISTSTAS